MKIFRSKRTILAVIIPTMVILLGFFISYSSLNSLPKVNTINNINTNVQQKIPIQVSYSQQIFDKCEYDMHCVVENLTNISNNENKTIGLSTFEELISLYHKKQQNFRCHHIAHHLGEWIYGNTQSLDESMAYADPLSCGGGIYHGIFENYFSVQKFHKINPDLVEIKNLCSNMEDYRYSLDTAHCLHGLGHGLLILYDYEVFKAVKRCEDFNSVLKRNSCANGIFMENVLKYFETGEGQFDDTDLFYPCNRLSSQFASTCYIWQGPYILKQHSFEVYSSFDQCDKIDEKFIKNCYYGIGIELEPDAKGKMEKALLFCQAGKIVAYHKYCLRGMLMTTSMVYLSNGFSFCPLVPEQFKEECYDGLGFWINLRYEKNADRENYCSRGTENLQYLEVCLNPKIDGISFL